MSPSIKVAMASICLLPVVVAVSIQHEMTAREERMVEQQIRIYRLEAEVFRADEWRRRCRSQLELQTWLTDRAIDGWARCAGVQVR